MPTFPSREWMDAFAAQVQAHEQAGAVASQLDGVYRFVIEPAGPLTDRHTYDLQIRSNGGKPNVQVVDGPQEPKLTLSADYNRWRQLILGELDVGLALLLRRLRISGDLRGVASNLSSTDPLMHSLSAVDTEWLN